MRPYRGKRKDNNEWVYGWYLEMPGKQKAQVQDEGYGVVSCKLKDAETIPVIAYKSKTQVALDYSKVIPSTVGQSTGLCDKNGKEVYEGDKVEFDAGSGPETAVIEFQEHCYHAGFFPNKSTNDSCYWKIIGNVHEEAEDV